MDMRLVERLAEEHSRFGSAVQPPCSDEQIQLLIQRARTELGAVLPIEYLGFLGLTNGLDWNGVVVYAAETVPLVGHSDRSISGVVEANLGFRDDVRFQDLLVLGSNGMDLYTVRLSTGVCAIYDEIPHELLEQLDTCDELLARALTRSLQ
jgi:hypothetical protein